MYEKYNKKIYEIKPICPSICPPKPSKPHQIRKEYYPPKPRAVGSSPSAPAINKSETLIQQVFRAFFIPEINPDKISVYRKISYNIRKSLQTKSRKTLKSFCS